MPISISVSPVLPGLPLDFISLLQIGGLCNRVQASGMWVRMMFVPWPTKPYLGLSILCLFPHLPTRGILSSGKSLEPQVTSWSRASMHMSLNHIIGLWHEREIEPFIALSTWASVLWPIHFISLNFRFLICKIDVVILILKVVMKIKEIHSMLLYLCLLELFKKNWCKIVTTSYSWIMCLLNNSFSRIYSPPSFLDYLKDLVKLL